MGEIYWYSEEMLGHMAKQQQGEELIRLCHEVMKSVVRDNIISTEDLAQELALKLWEMGDDGRKCLKSESWLRCVARNLRTDHLRRYFRKEGSRPHEPFHDEVHSDSSQSPDELVEARLDAEDSYNLLRSDLSDKERDLFDLRRRHPDAPYAWLACRLMMTEQATRMMWSRILSKKIDAEEKCWSVHAGKFLRKPTGHLASKLLAHSAPEDEGVAHYLVACGFNDSTDPWSPFKEKCFSFELMDRVHAAEWHAKQAVLLAPDPVCRGCALLEYANALLLKARYFSGGCESKAREAAVEGWEISKIELFDLDWWADYDLGIYFMIVARLFTRLGLADRRPEILDSALEVARQAECESAVADLDECSQQMIEYDQDPDLYW